MGQENAFTGLEAAIILIAFVIIASIFSQLVLGAGILTTQSAQETIYTGTNNAGSAMYVSGNIKGVRTQLTNPQSIRSVLIPLRTVGEGEGIDIRTMRIRVISESNLEELTLNQTYMNINPRSGRWSVQSSLNSDGDSLLEEGEEFLINATLLYSADMVPYHTFTIELKSVGGGIPLRISRTIPSALFPLTNLE